MELRWLTFFVAATDLCGMSAAAPLFHINRPALSQKVIRLRPLP
jgi:DNA-binding transcriptional LysR family regulator